jgi:MarR family transcriptional regulator, 2-MHQ and catechol-resistance regulon repressor
MSLENELNLEHPMDDIQHEAVLSIVRTAGILSLKGSDLFRQFGLTEAQFNVLFSLKYKETVWTQSDLGKRLVLTRASVTSVLDKLETKGLVERKVVEGNRRIYHVDLTKSGKVLIDEVEPLYRQDVHEVMADLGRKTCEAMIRNLEKVRARCVR